MVPFHWGVLVCISDELETYTVYKNKIQIDIDIEKMETPSKTIPAPKELEYNIHACSYLKIVAGASTLARWSPQSSIPLSAFCSCAKHCIEQSTQTIG